MAHLMGYTSGMVNYFIPAPSSTIGAPMHAPLSGLFIGAFVMPKINTVPFGNKTAIAEGLTAKSADKQGKFLVLALLPVASSVIAGHPTFLALVRNNKASPKCPLQTAIAGLSGKSRKAREAVFSAIKPASSQEEHDATVAELESLIYEAMENVPRATRTGPTPSELLKSENASLHASLIERSAECEALRAECEALRAECEALRAECEALRAVTATQPATV